MYLRASKYLDEHARVRSLIYVSAFLTVFFPLYVVLVWGVSYSICQGFSVFKPKIVNEYDQEIPQSQTADNPMAPRGRAAQPSRDTRKTN